MILEKVDYDSLNARQRENYNFMKLGAKLADYGFVAMKLSDDWQGADLIACHIDGKRFLRIQLKGRCCFYEKYRGKDLWIAFRIDEIWYLFPHDVVLEQMLGNNKLQGTVSWDERGGYSFPKPSKQLLHLLRPYVLR